MPEPDPKREPGSAPGTPRKDADAGTAPPAAGPHAAPDLTEPEKTPGAGSLPDPDRPQEGDATTG